MAHTRQLSPAARINICPTVEPVVMHVGERFATRHIS